jgi:hypothetical protein
MESLLHSTGAVAGNRTRILELATRDSAVETPPHGNVPSRSRDSHPPPLATCEVPRSLGLGGKCSDKNAETFLALYPLSYGPTKLDRRDSNPRLPTPEV